MKCFFSSEAEADLLDIIVFSYRERGRTRTERYLDDMEAACDDLSAGKHKGRRSDFDRELYRYRQEQHVIYYRFSLGGLLISRILHVRQLANVQFFPTSEDE